MYGYISRFLMNTVGTIDTLLISRLVLEKASIDRLGGEALGTIADFEDLESVYVSDVEAIRTHLGNLGRLLEVVERRSVEGHEVCR